MKKITLFILVFPLILIGQVSISVKDAYEIKSYTLDVPSYWSEIINVPTGESWLISSNGNDNTWDDPIYFYISSNNPISGQISFSAPKRYFPQGMWTEGTTIEVKMVDGNSSGKIDYVVYKFNNSDITLAANSYQQPNNSKILVYPNPTPKVLALNSEKIYNITVYDLAGNKVMEAKGNTLDLQQLSNSTYIIKALDSTSKEILSYKIIKE